MRRGCLSRWVFLAVSLRTDLLMVMSQTPHLCSRNCAEHVPFGSSNRAWGKWGFIARFIRKGCKIFGKVCWEPVGSPAIPLVAQWTSPCATISTQPVPCCPHAPNAGAKTPPHLAPETLHAAIARPQQMWHLYEATCSLPRWPQNLPTQLSTTELRLLPSPLHPPRWRQLT